MDKSIALFLCFEKCNGTFQIAMDYTFEFPLNSMPVPIKRFQR